MTVLGAAVVLDSEMMVGSQAGNAPNDIAGIFFLLATIAFLVNGAASAPRRVPPRGAREAAAPLEPAPESATEERRHAGVVEDVPVAGDPRALATVGAGPLFLAGLAAGLGIGTKVTLLADDRRADDRGRHPGRPAALAARARRSGSGAMVITSGFWYGRNIVTRPQPVPADRQARADRPAGPARSSCSTRARRTSSASTTTTRRVWDDKFFPVLHDRLGPLWPVILAAVIVGLILALVLGPQPPDAGPRGHRHRRRDRLRVHAADRLGRVSATRAGSTRTSATWPRS